MHDSTADDMELLLKEENIATLTHLIQQAVNATGITQAVTELQQTRRELADARDELKVAAAKFITIEDSEKMVQEFADQIRTPLTQSVDTNMREMREADAQRNQAFDLRIGEINALVLTQGGELSTLKAVFEEKIDAHAKRLAKVETDIKDGVAAVAKNTRTLSQAVGRYLEESREQKKKTDADVKALSDAKIEFEKQLLETKDDTLNLRGDVDGLRADIATKVTTTDYKVKHIESQVNDVKQHQSNHQSQLIQLTASFTEFQIQLKSAMWLLNTWVGRGVAATILVLLGLSNLVN